MVLAVKDAGSFVGSIKIFRKTRRLSKSEDVPSERLKVKLHSGKKTTLDHYKRASTKSNPVSVTTQREAKLLEEWEDEESLVKRIQWNDCIVSGFCEDKNFEIIE